MPYEGAWLRLWWEVSYENSPEEPEYNSHGDLYRSVEDEHEHVSVRLALLEGDPEKNREAGDSEDIVHTGGGDDETGDPLTRHLYWATLD